MKETNIALKFQVIHDGKFYEFNEGVKVYIFHLGIRFEHYMRYGTKSLLNYVDLVSRCIYADINSCVIADLAAFVTKRWRTVKSMDKYELLDFYYDHKN